MMPSRGDAPSIAIKLARIAKAIGDDPLWSAFSVSRELFHSNMLQWSAVHTPSIVEAVFDLPRTGVAFDARREYLDLDLVLMPRTGGETAVVVENKLFSLPDEAQLDRYRSRIRLNRTLKSATLVLLSLQDPGWPSGSRDEWRWLSYSDLGTRLTEALAPRLDFATQVMAHWASLCRQLDAFVQMISVTKGEDLFFLPTIVEPRLRTFAEKVRFGQLADRVRHHTAVPVNVGFTRGGPLVEAFWTLVSGDRVGWQVQNRELRVCLRVSERASVGGISCHGTGPGAVAARKTYATKYFSQLFDSTELNVAKWRRSANGGWKSFNPSLVYRGRMLEDNATMEALVRVLTGISQRLSAFASTGTIAAVE